MMIKESLIKIILSPHITNKSYDISDKSSYVVFKVVKSANKIEIKNAIEALFEVEVENVKTINVKGKLRNFNRIKGKSKDWKKAYIKLKKGHEINFVNTE